MKCHADQSSTEYAAAFFLLAGNVRDAVNVCASQMQDIQLAIAVIRVHEGDDSPLLQELLLERVLPMAAEQGNRWMATWAFWMLGKRDMATRALIVSHRERRSCLCKVLTGFKTPIDQLIDKPVMPSQEARSFLKTDPALVALYKQLRGKTLQTLKGASMISPREEWEFIMQIARLYDRMGCDVLALDLGKSLSQALQLSATVIGIESLAKRSSSAQLGVFDGATSSTEDAGSHSRPP